MLVLEEIELEALNPASVFLQTPFWAKVKAEGGWKPWAFQVRNTPHGETATLLVLVRRFAGILSFGYVPHGPALDLLHVEEGRIEEALEALSRELLGYLPLGCLFIRYDLAGGISHPVGADEVLPRPPLKPLKRAPMDIQPPDTVLLSLDPGEEEILAGMHKKTRYNIRLASKKGVEVKESGEDDLRSWYGLYQETAERDRIAIHPYDYYRRVFSEARKSGGILDAELLTAWHEGDLLAGIIVLYCGKTATYLYGASTSNKRNLMPAYALQWEAIRRARHRNCSLYDFFGIPPVNDPGHPMYGLYRFKTGFGGKILHRYGCWDYPFSKIVYPLYRAAESLRKWYYKSLKKRR